MKLRNAFVISIIASLLFTAVAPADTAPGQLSLGEASTLGLVGGYIYRWDNAAQEYAQPIAVGLGAPISPYGTYWVELLTAPILLSTSFPGLNLITTEPANQPDSAPDFPYVLSQSSTWDDMKYYYFTLPVADDTNIYSVFNAWSGGTLTQTGHSSFDWGVMRYIYNHNSSITSTDPNYRESKIFYVDEPDYTYGESMYAGQGYILYHNSPTFFLTAPAGLTKPTGIIKRQLPLWLENDETDYTLHHVGNPFWATINIDSNIFIDAPLDMTLPVGKIASTSSLNDIESWHLTLTLTTADGTSIDAYNRAGITTDYQGDTRGLKALDLIDPNDLVNLSLHDPDSEYTTRFGYDIRSAGQSNYTWDIELTTVESVAHAVLTIGNFANVPSDYIFTLIDPMTGDSWTLDADTNIPVSLNGNEVKSMLLSAVPVTTSVDDNAPAAFGLEYASPNPFNPSTAINYSLESGEMVSISVYNLNGQLIEILINSHQSAGRHSVVWNAVGNASGLYFVVLDSGSHRDAMKITLMK